MSFFDQKQIDAAKAKASQFKQLEIGCYPNALLKNIELKNTKAGDPMLIFEFEIEGFSLKEYMAFTAGQTFNVEKLVRWMSDSFGYVIQPVNAKSSEEEIMGVYEQIKQFIGRNLAIVVKHNQELYTKFEEDKVTIAKKMIITKPAVWFVGKEGTMMPFNREKAVTVLKPEHKAELDAYEAKIASAEQKKKGTSTEMPAAQARPSFLDEEDDLPF